MLSIISKFQNNKKKHIKQLNKKIISNINNISKKIEKKRNITFVHSGHLGDIINSLPVVKEISKEVKCNFLIKTHSSKNINLTKDAFNKIYPLLKSQPYISKVDQYRGQKIDINLDFFRGLPINFNVDSVRWYSHLTGVFPDLNKPYLLNIKKNMNIKTVS